MKNMELLENLIQDIEKELKENKKEQINAKIQIQKHIKHLEQISKLSENDIQELIENNLI